LAAKPSLVGVDVDTLGYPMYRPMVCGSHTKGQGFLSGAASSHRAAAVGDEFPGDVKPRAWIFDGVLTI
jgi:hypothetical protein